MATGVHGFAVQGVHIFYEFHCLTRKRMLCRLRTLQLIQHQYSRTSEQRTHCISSIVERLSSPWRGNVHFTEGLSLEVTLYRYSTAGVICWHWEGTNCKHAGLAPWAKIKGHAPPSLHILSRMRLDPLWSSSNGDSTPSANSDYSSILLCIK